MKKVLFTAFTAMAFFAMTACNNNAKTDERADDTTGATTEQCDTTKCDKHCEGDTAMCCKGEAVEGQACEHKCAKAEGQECCKGKAEGKECCKEKK